MAKREPFDYEQFRRQAAQQLRMGADVNDLLAPVIQNLLETALRPDDPSVGEFIENKEPAGVNECPPEKTLPDATQSKPTGHASSSHDSARQVSVLPPSTERFILDHFNLGSTYENILSLLASTEDYVEVADLMKITDQLLPRIKAWQNRRLEPVYAYLWLTSVPCQLRLDDRVGNRPACVILAIDLHGRQDILGYYVGERDVSELWPVLINDLRVRGVEDILIACGDEPVGLSQAFAAIYPQTHVHTSLMLQLRNSLPYLVGADRNVAIKALRTLCDVVDARQAERLWQAFRADWSERYPLLIDTWDRNWTKLMASMAYPVLVQKRMHRFEFLETLQQKLLRYQKENGPYLSEDEFRKDAYRLSCRLLLKNKARVQRWGLIIQYLNSLFGERAKKHLTA